MIMGWKSVGVFAVAWVIFFGALLMISFPHKSKCDEKGGIIIDGKCLGVEVIKL